MHQLETGCRPVSFRRGRSDLASAPVNCEAVMLRNSWIWATCGVRRRASTVGSRVRSGIVSRVRCKAAML